MAKEIPVYLFVGFLESGKTKFIQETFEDPNFDSGDKTLLLICEEGEEEYNPKKFAFPGVPSAFFGSLPTATYSQNVGIVTTNKVVNRVVFALAGGFLLLAGLIPKFSAILTTIPQCVLGGATITVFSTIAMTGMKLIASETISPRNTTIVGLAAALGVGISQSSSALSQFPESITIIFGKTPVVIATIMAVLLNLILPQENKDQ